MLGSRVLAAGAAVCLLLGCGSDATKTYDQTLSIVFNPMYSGYDGVHMYQIPATIENAGVTGVTNVQWSASDSSMVALSPMSDGVSVMITTKKAGKVTIIAHTDVAEGKAPLTITQYTPDQWAAGMTRYNSGAMVTPGTINGQSYVACTSCHGDSPMSLAVQHTPEQTGGFTDDQIKNVFLMGILPPSDQNPLDLDPMTFQSFHQWMVANDAEAVGLIAYLRSLTPKDQGQLNWGGRNRGDGGVHRCDGGCYRDGGMSDAPSP